MTRPRFWLWILVVGLLALLGLAGGGYWLIQRQVSRTIAESARIEARMLRALQERDRRRPTLGPADDPGDAREIYAAVLPRMSTLSRDEEDLLFHLWWSERGSSELPHEEKIRALLAKTAPMLAALRPVVRRSTLGPRQSSLPWPDPELEEVRHWGNFHCLVSAHAYDRVLHDAIDQAVDLQVLRWFAALDFMRHGTLIAHSVGGSFVKSSATGLRRLLADCRVGSARLDLLATELDTLRSSTPALADTWRTEEIHVRMLIREAAAGGLEVLGDDASRAGLPYWFSKRRLYADALENLTSCREALEGAVEGVSGHVGARAARAFANTLRDGPNELLAQWASLLASSVVREAERTTLLELLRVTVALARHREKHGRKPATLSALVPEFLAEIPLCPYSGQALHYDGDKLWSIGTDGVDDGGEPMAFDLGMQGEGDVVFTLRPLRLQHFPWSAQVPLAVRARVEEAIGALYLGGRDGRLARDELIAMDVRIAGRLVSEFHAISKEPGFASAEGRVRAAVIDDTLRRMDGLMERYWCDQESLFVGTEVAKVEQIAARWTNWWYRKQWSTDPTEAVRTGD